MAPGYRWETLRKLRQAACDAAAAALATAANARADQEKAVLAARDRRQEAESRLGAYRDRARQKQVESFRGVDWQRAQAFDRRLVAEVETMSLALTEARAQLLGAEEKEERARDALVKSRRELEVLERDRARVEAEERKAAEHREEAEAEDLVAARWKIK